MKRNALLVMLALLLYPVTARAQTVTPPAPTAEPTLVAEPTPLPAGTASAALPSGEVSGKIVDQNTGQVVTESQEVMLHIWDADSNSVDMLHATSAADGMFLFTAVDLQPQYFYGVMAVFQGVTYLSQVVPPSKDSNQLSLDVPVYESTKDLSQVRIDQMHVLFKFAEDGMEVTEIYALSNNGDRTVKDAVQLEDGKTATLRFPLPANANYIFFQPDEDGRFVKFAGGFADTSPLLVRKQGDQYAVQFLIPYSGKETLDYTAPVDIAGVNFLLPQDSGVTLQADGLGAPQPVTFDSGKSYDVYSMAELPAGKSFHVALSGKPKAAGAANTGQWKLPIALGGGLLGLAMVGTAIWWWRKPEESDASEADEPAEPDQGTLDAVVARIAELDAAHERGEVDDAAHRRERARLRAEARKLMMSADE